MSFANKRKGSAILIALVIIFLSLLPVVLIPIFSSMNEMADRRIGNMRITEQSAILTYSRAVNAQYVRCYGDTLIKEQNIVTNANPPWANFQSGYVAAKTGFDSEITFDPGAVTTMGSCAQGGGWPAGIVVDGNRVAAQVPLVTFPPITQVISAAIGNGDERNGTATTKDDATLYHGSSWGERAFIHFQGETFRASVNMKTQADGKTYNRTVVKTDYVCHIPLCNFPGIWYQNYDAGDFAKTSLTVPSSVYASAADAKYPVLSGVQSSPSEAHPIATGIISSRNEIVGDQAYADAIATSMTADAYFCRLGYINQAIRANAIQLTTSAPEQWTDDGLYPPMGVPTIICGGIVWTETASEITIDVMPEQITNRDGVMIKCGQNKRTVINIRDGGAAAVAKLVSVWGEDRTRTIVNQFNHLGNPVIVQIRDAQVQAAGVSMQGMFLVGPGCQTTGINNFEVFGTYMAPAYTGVPSQLRLHAGPAMGGAVSFMQKLARIGPCQIATFTSISDPR